MPQDAGQPFHDAEAETQPPAALGRRIVQLAELDEDVLQLVLWNADSGVPDLDAERSGSPATAQQHPAGSGVADRVAEEVAQDAPQQGRMAAHSDARPDHPERQPVV